MDKEIKGIKEMEKITNRCRIFLLLLIASLASLFQAQAQQGQYHQEEIKYPEVGMPCPEFVIRNLEYYSKKEATISDFRSKWLILDFYDKNCGACIAQFPRYNSNQKEFEDKVQFILVGREDREDKIRTIYARYRQQQNLLLPCAFDSSIFSKLDINSSPYTIIIDPNGIVQYITNVFDTKELANILKGNKPLLGKAYRQHESRPLKYKYDANVPFLVNNNGGVDTDFLFRSLLSIFDPLKQDTRWPASIEYTNEWIQKYHIYRFDALGLDVNSLYRYAYFGRRSGISFKDSLYGKLWPKNILELRDSTIFQSTETDEYFSKTKRYCYSLTVSPSKYSRGYLMEMMQRDLRNYFDFNVNFEVRRMPYWRLIATEEAKLNLKTKGGNAFYTPADHEYRDSVVIKNMPISFLIERVLPVSTSEMPFIDETGIDSNIDITLNYFGSPGLDVLKNALRVNGLELVMGEKEMRVLIIRDR